jgi:hypothetical protein
MTQYLPDEVIFHILDFMCMDVCIKKSFSYLLLNKQIKKRYQMANDCSQGLYNHCVYHDKCFIYVKTELERYKKNIHDMRPFYRSPEDRYEFIHEDHKHKIDEIKKCLKRLNVKELGTCCNGTGVRIDPYKLYL